MTSSCSVQTTDYHEQIMIITIGHSNKSLSIKKRIKKQWEFNVFYYYYYYEQLFSLGSVIRKIPQDSS
jgi:hypothetical protein